MPLDVSRHRLASVGKRGGAVLNESAVLRSHERSAALRPHTRRASPSHARVEELTVRDRMIVDAAIVLRGRQEQLPRRATRQGWRSET
jgi:hypothetical protein